FTPHAAQTLAAQIVRRQADGARVFDIRLDPPELGRVGVRLEMSADQTVKAMLSAERPDTLQDMQRSARELEKALAEAGLSLAENGLSFSLGGGRGQGEGASARPGPAARSELAVEIAAPGAPAPELYGFALARPSGLDIRA
ncbi:MAG: flagellar hook-length control protein FliK, partial [Oceanicaulis sp.]|nr:flagellar hook-length control protein FliK [Oceanicaulis sp.]